METIGKLIAAALICCALSLLLRKQAPELTLALCAVVCALCFLTVLPFFSPVLAFVRRLEEITGLSQAVFAPLFKTAAIGLLSSRRSGRRSRSAAAFCASIWRCRCWRWCFLCCRR